MIILLIIVLSVLSSIAYRAGGSSKGNTLYRDLGCPLINIISLCLAYRWHWSLLVCFPLLWGSYSTYRYFLPKPKDYTWLNYAMHGFFTSFSFFPYALFTNCMVWLLVRSVISAIAVAWWSIAISNDKWEERGRGFIINATILTKL